MKLNLQKKFEKERYKIRMFFILNEVTIGCAVLPNVIHSTSASLFSLSRLKILFLQTLLLYCMSIETQVEPCILVTNYFYWFDCKIVEKK